jgi:hypothetical protein
MPNDLNGFFLLLLLVPDAICKAFKHAEFHRKYKKLSRQRPDPLMPEEMEKQSAKMPRDSRKGRYYQQKI